MSSELLERNQLRLEFVSHTILFRSFDTENCQSSDFVFSWSVISFLSNQFFILRIPLLCSNNCWLIRNTIQIDSPHISTHERNTARIQLEHQNQASKTSHHRRRSYTFSCNRYGMKRPAFHRTAWIDHVPYMDVAIESKIHIPK